MMIMLSQYIHINYVSYIMVFSFVRSPALRYYNRSQGIYTYILTMSSILISDPCFEIWILIPDPTCSTPWDLFRHFTTASKCEHQRHDQEITLTPTHELLPVILLESVIFFRLVTCCICENHIDRRHWSIINRERDGCLDIILVPSNLYVHGTFKPED